MGSGGSTTQYRNRDPESPELISLRSNLYNAVMPGLQSFSPSDWDTAKQTANNAIQQQAKLLDQLPSTLNQNSSIASEIANVARTGNIPSGVTNRLNASVNQNLQSGMGTMLNNLANRGVVNSSITGQGINNLSKQAADAYNRNYLNAYQSTIGGLSAAMQGQQANMSALMSAANMLGNVPTQAYEAAGAGITPAFNLWKAWQNSYDNRQDYDTVVQQWK